MKNSSPRVVRLLAPFLAAGPCVGIPCFNHKPTMDHMGSVDAVKTCIQALDVSASPFEELLSAAVSSVSRRNVETVKGVNRIGRSRSIHTSKFLSCERVALPITFLRTSSRASKVCENESRIVFSRLRRLTYNGGVLPAKERMISRSLAAHQELNIPIWVSTASEKASIVRVIRRK